MIGKFTKEVGSAAKALSEVFANPALRNLELSWGALSVATWSFAIALSVYAFEYAGVAAVGLIALIRLAPGALVSPLAGLFSDKKSRRTVLIASCTLVAIALGLATAIDLADGPAALIFVLAGLFTVASTPFLPAQAALMPQLSRTPRELAAANLVYNIMDNAGFLIGSLGTGLALALGPPGLAFGFATAASLVSILACLGLPADHRPGYSQGVELRTLVGETLSGFRLIAADPALRLPGAMMALLALVEGAADVLVVITALDFLGLTKATVGYLNAAWGIGGLIGGAGLAIVLNRGHLIRSALVGAVILGSGIVLPAILPVAVAAYAGFLIFGAGHSFVDVASNTLLQRVGDDESLGRIRGSLESLRLGAMAIGSILVPLGVSLVGVRGTLVIAAFLLPVYLVLRSGRLRSLETGAPLDERHFDLLRSSPIFSPLPIATLERICHEVEEVEFGTGQPIVEEGEVGDCFYLLDQGEVEVYEGDVFKRILEPGDGFGEIALLHDVRRTATVRATTPCLVLSLGREHFLDAVTGHSRSHETARSVADGWLSSDPASR